MAESAGTLIRCIMCKNETPSEFLRKHITFHHMIQEDELVDKIHKMHFPSREMEVQTTVSWVHNMIQLEETIDKIEKHLEVGDKNVNEITPPSIDLKMGPFGIIVDETQEPTDLNIEELYPDQSCFEESDVIEKEDLTLRLYRFRCPYCDTFGDSTGIYDHIFKEHSIPSTSKTFPRYRKPKKQRMCVKIRKTKLAESETHSYRTEPRWLPCDATLPQGWKYSDRERQKCYMSPDGTFLESRDLICEYLLGMGFDIFHPSGYKSITPSLVDCDGLCEGSCDNFKIRNVFYEDGDTNKKRKNTRITYLNEAEVEMIKDDLSTDIEKNIEDIKPITYRPPAMKGQRPWIISIRDKSDTNEDSFRSPRFNLETSEQCGFSSRESTPSSITSGKRKRSLGRKALRSEKKVRSSSRESISKPSVKKSAKSVDKVEYDGIYVQCCKKKCQKWRLVTEFADASLVPDYWICSMNRDKSNSMCGVGGNNFSSDAPDIDIKFSRGSLVWAKLKGFPWWPGMIDSCPDSQEYFWVDENICSHEPCWYHVVYFEGRGTEVSRAWIRADDIVSMTTPITQPYGSTATRSGPLKQRLKNAIEMAESAKSHPRKVRLEKFSFNTLFENNSKKGKLNGSHKSHEIMKYETVSVKKKEREASRNVLAPGEGEKYRGKRAFITGPIFSDEEGENSESDKTDKELTQDSDEELLSQILKKYSTLDDKSEDLPLTGSDEDKEEAILEETLLSEYSNDHVTETDLDIKQEDVDPSEIPPKETPPSKNISSNCMTEVFIKPEELISTLNPNLDREFSKPPLPSDVLIALAVRNLDPNNEHGVTFSKIAAFLSLHFPYYNRNYEECKEMIRSAYESSEDIEKENFRIKSSLVPHLLVRINKFVTKNSHLIRESMLLAEFLDPMLERFEVGRECEATKYRPPYSCKMLSHLAFITLCPPTSIEQVMIFLRFLFPSLDQSKTFVEKDFKDWITNDEMIQEYLSPGGDKMYLLQEGVYPEVLHQVREFFSTKTIFVRLNKSIFKSKFVDLLLPNL